MRSFTLKKGFVPKPRDHFHDRFSLTRTFGAASADLPARFSVEDARGDVNGPQQQLENFCTACTQAEMAADQWGVAMSMKFSALAISLVNHSPIYSSGASIDDGMKSGRVYGYLPLSLEPQNIQDMGAGDEAKICDPSNWPSSVYAAALKYQIAGGDFYVDGPYDAFDNYRAAIYQHRPDNGIAVGLPWYSLFNQTPETGIARAPSGGFAWHDVDMKGWETINGVLYIKIRSWDIDSGADTYFYFSRSIWNKLMAVQGSVGKMFKPVDAVLADQLKNTRASLAEQLMNLYYQVSFKLAQIGSNK